VAWVDCFSTATAAYKKGAPFYNAWPCPLAQLLLLFVRRPEALRKTACPGEELCRDRAPEHARPQHE
jgi:hypothetical protein